MNISVVHASHWIVDTLALVCGCVVCVPGVFLFSFFLSLTLKHTHTVSLSLGTLGEITASCVSPDLVLAALLSARILPTAHTSHCI